MGHKIEYSQWTFESDKIKSGNLYLATSLPGSSLEVDSFVVIVECNDPSILDFERNAQLKYYSQPNLPKIFRVQDIKRVGPTLYKISSTSTLGLLTEGRHMGGIYTGQTADVVIQDICGSVPVIVKTVLRKIKLYGWLPIAEPRNNLAQVLLAIGATLKTDLDGVLRIEGLWDGFSGQISKNKMYVNANADYSARITQVIVTEHQYVPGTEEKQLFEGTAQAGNIITFDEPMHSLTANGFTIQNHGANWARISAGSGTLTGKTYIHNTRQISLDVQSAQTPNVKTVENATLVSLANSQAVVKRLAEYYKCREQIDAPVVYKGEDPGDRLAVWHPFDKMCVDACLESADITLSNTMKAQAKLLVGYVPPQFDDTEYFDTTEEITGSKNWPIPDGVTEVTAVIIGGGQGGQKGGDGENGGAGTNAYAVGNLARPSELVQGTPGVGGAGGTKGSGGSGGKILIVDINVSQISTLTANIGAGGASNGGAGNPSTVIAGGVTYSSNSGSTSETGYTDIFTGKTYAVSGDSGSYDGGKGGDGVSGTTGSGGTGESVAGYSGGAGNRFAYEYGGVRYALPAGGGGAAYGNSGGAAPDTCDGGSGGNAVQDRFAPTTPGCGGHGGNGGGGGGGGGAGYINGGLPSSYISAQGRPGGSAGSGSNGTMGAPGIVLLFYRKPQKVLSGRFVDKNGRNILDSISRRMIV